MPEPSGREVTCLLVAWRGGDDGSLEQLVSLEARSREEFVSDPVPEPEP